jgi:hypothetical protein
LELHKQLIFRAGSLGCFDEQRLNSVAGQFLNQQNLVSILAAQPVRRVHQHDLNLPFSGKIPHTLKPRSFQRRSTIAIIFEDPLFGNLQIVTLGKLDQRRRLARYRVRLPLLIGRDPCVDRCHPHDRTPLHCRRRDAPE